jgi:elongation factor Ts
MAEITASLVKDLREKTGAGMMDAKKALNETKGDFEAAVEFLRKKGLATADKKSSRTAAEGLVAIATQGPKGSIVEVNSETDFVARNEEFQAYVRKATETALAKGANDVESLGPEASTGIANLIAKIGENMRLRRVASLSVKNGVVAGYIHNAVGPNVGKIGVLVALESTGDTVKLQELGKQISMHIAAAFPKYLDRTSVDASHLEKEKNFLREQAKASGKADDIIEKMLEGRLRKFYEEVCLVDQLYIMDNEKTVAKILLDAEKTVGAPVKITGYVRFQLGEGIEVEKEDFAAEVAKTAKAVNG